MTLVIHINGWPGSGKATIARRLAATIGGRLVENHTLLNPAECLFDRGDPLYWSLRRDVRRLLFDHAERVDPAIPLIFTDALADDTADRKMFGEIVGLAWRRQARLLAVVLDCEADENRRRLTAASRADHFKLVDPGVLDDLRERYTLLRPTAVDAPDVTFASATLDVTDLTVDDAVARLAAAADQ